MSLTKFATFAFLAFGVDAADWKDGSCPDIEQNKSEFDLRSMAGMWFEYVWDQGFAEDYGYECSTWLVLQDTDNYIAINHMTFEEEEKEGRLEQFVLGWDPVTEDGFQRARAKYTRQTQTEEAQELSHKERTMQISETDYWSYAVGVSCLENESGDKHQQDYFVWTRYKRPAIYMRRKAREALLKLGVEPEDRMTKGPIVKCWGEDMG